MTTNPVLRALFACACATAATVAVRTNASAAAIDPVSVDSGSHIRQGRSPDNNSSIDDHTRNNCFAFDLAGLTGSIRGARLTVFGGNGDANASGANLAFTVHDVSTDLVF